MADKKKLNEENAPGEEKDNASKVGGVPDAADNKGVDETLGDYETEKSDEEEEVVKVGSLQAHRAEDGVEEKPVEEPKPKGVFHRELLTKTNYANWNQVVGKY